MLTKLPAIEKLSPRIIRILGCNPGTMTLQGTNTYLLGTGRQRMLVDAGERDNKSYISSLLGVLGEQKAGISDLIITHWHSDHLGGVCDVLNATNKQAVVHKFPSIDPPDEGLPDWVILQPLMNHQEVSVEGATVKAHHTPGHTSDHLSLELLGDDADAGVFTGDCILGESTTVFEDLYDYMNSLKVLKKISHGHLYPGHGPFISNGPETIQHYIDHRNAREEQIFIALLDQPASTSTPNEMVKVVYKGTPSRLHLVAECNLRLHLNKLVRDGRVNESQGTYTALESGKINDKGKI